MSWAEAPIKIARMTLTIKLDRNWSSFQLANNTPPLSVTGSVIAPSARMHHDRAVSCDRNFLTFASPWPLLSRLRGSGQNLGLWAQLGASARTHTYIHSYTHARTHTQSHTRTHAIDTCAHTQTYLRTSTHTNTHTSTHTHRRTRTRCADTHARACLRRASCQVISTGNVGSLGLPQKLE